MKIISVVNQKGGVGKTTTSINLAAGLAKMNKKILLIDLDPQGNSTTSFKIKNRDYNIYNLLCCNVINEDELSKYIYDTNIKNLFLLPSIVDLSAIEVEAANLENKNYFLSKIINNIKNASFNFDLILIDCPPSLGLLTINALTISDSILIPMQCEFFSLEGLSHLLNSIELVKGNLNKKLKISGIILTMHDSRNSLTHQVEKDIRSYLDKFVYKTIIPRNVKLSEAPSHQMPAINYDPKASGSLAYMEFVNEFIMKEKL